MMQPDGQQHGVRQAQNRWPRKEVLEPDLSPRVNLESHLVARPWGRMERGRAQWSTRLEK